MDFEELRIFLVLAEEGTFLGAANRLETSRSRVRRKLDHLERDAGTQLLAREPDGLKLTAAGGVLARRGRALLEDARQLVSHVHEVGHDPTGRLKVVLPIGAPSADCVEACRTLQSRFPSVEIAVFFSARPTTWLPDRAEIALTFEESFPPGCEVTLLTERPMRLLMSPAYREAHGTPRSGAELAHHRIAVWGSMNSEFVSLPLRGGKAVNVHPMLVADDPAVVTRFARAGDCIAYVPDLPSLRDRTLEPVLEDDLVAVAREHLVVPAVLADVPRVREFSILFQSKREAFQPFR